MRLKASGDINLNLNFGGGGGWADHLKTRNRLSNFSRVVGSRDAFP